MHGAKISRRSTKRNASSAKTFDFQGRSNKGRKPVKRVTFSLPSKRKKVENDSSEVSISVMSERVVRKNVDHRKVKIGSDSRARGAKLQDRPIQKSHKRPAIRLPMVELKGLTIIHQSAVSWGNTIDAPVPSSSVKFSRLCTVWAPPDQSLLNF